VPSWDTCHTRVIPSDAFSFPFLDVRLAVSGDPDTVSAWCAVTGIVNISISSPSIMSSYPFAKEWVIKNGLS